MTLDITGVDLRKFVKEVYNLSQPVGLGFIHYESGELDEEAVSEILIREESNNPYDKVLVHMDYIRGRCCKMLVWKDKETGALTIRDQWYDHTDAQLDELLKRCGIEKKEYVDPKSPSVLDTAAGYIEHILGKKPLEESK